MFWPGTFVRGILSPCWVIWGETTPLFPLTASQARGKQKGKDTCPFPIAVYFGLHWL